MRWATAVTSVLAGAVAAGFGLWLGQPSSDQPVADVVTPAVATPLPAGPVSLGPTVLVPVSLRLEGREVVFSYELVDKAPPAGPTIFVNSDTPVIAPEEWTMSTVAGPVAGSTATVRATTARFGVPEGFTLDQIGSITLESYRIRLPLRHAVELHWADTDPVALDEEIAVGVRRILEQASSTLVQLALEAPTDAFASAGGAFGAQFEAAPRAAGVGPDWTNIGPISGGVQLTFVGEQLPDPFGVVVESSSWTKVERSTTFGVGGLADE